MRVHTHAKRSTPYILMMGLLTLLIQMPLLAADGRFVTDTIHSVSLEGNLLGDPADRNFQVYLPPSYDAAPWKRYPVVYLLHGSKGSPGYWRGGYMNLENMVDTLVTAGTVEEIIYVMPHANNRLGGSWYLSSVTVGDYETYLVEELVAHVDATYRTLAYRDSRGIAGLSMGGFGAMHLALKYPEVFGVVAGLAGQYDSDDAWRIRVQAAVRAQPRSFADYGRLAFFAQSGLGIAAAVSPNPNNPPFYLDLPFVLGPGNVLQEIPQLWQRYAEVDVLHGDLTRYVQGPVRLNGIMIVHGTADGNASIVQARALSEAMTNLDIDHVFAEHPGGHNVGNPTLWLPFLSDHLETLAVAAGDPLPSDGASDVFRDVELGWQPGALAQTHNVYLGTSREDVRLASLADPRGVLVSEGQMETKFHPGRLSLSTTYYWRIDEVNGVNPDSPWAGNVWSFTTGDFFVIDDFETYDANDNQIWYAWHDGLGYGAAGSDPYFAGNGTGAAVGDATTASYTEETIVHGGNQSMPIEYDNNKQGYSKYSDVELKLADQRDWTEQGVTELSLWFYGDLANAIEPLYVAISNSVGAPAVVVHDDFEAVTIDTWTEWIIPLQGLADQGIVLTDVDGITIGLGTQGNMTIPGGKGKIYIDDIRLYQSREATE